MCEVVIVPRGYLISRGALHFRLEETDLYKSGTTKLLGVPKFQDRPR